MFFWTMWMLSWK